jgi:hypothetical protein
LQHVSDILAFDDHVQSPLFGSCHVQLCQKEEKFNEKKNPRYLEVAVTMNIYVMKLKCCSWLKPTVLDLSKDTFEALRELYAVKVSEKLQL